MNFEKYLNESMEEVAFLQSLWDSDAINDTAFLIYADWLEERGNPLGEYIRLKHTQLRGSDKRKVSQADVEKFVKSYHAIFSPARGWRTNNSGEVYSWERGDDRIFMSPPHKLLTWVRKRTDQHSVTIMDRNNKVVHRFEREGDSFRTWPQVILDISHELSVALMNYREMILRVTRIFNQVSPIQIKDMPEELLTPMAWWLVYYKFDVNRIHLAGQAVAGTHVFVFNDVGLENKWHRVHTYKTTNATVATNYLDAYLSEYAASGNNLVGVIISQESAEKYKVDKLMWVAREENRYGNYVIHSAGNSDKEVTSEDFARARKEVSEYERGYFTSSRTRYDSGKEFDLSKPENLRKLVGGI